MNINNNIDLLYIILKININNNMDLYHIIKKWIIIIIMIYYIL